MPEMLTVSEAAERIGVSDRRVRAMIAAGRLPAQQILGRWAVADDAVSTFTDRPAGRPLSQRSAWQVLGYLTGTVRRLPARLEQRVLALDTVEHPEKALVAWTASRGKVARLSGSSESMAGLEADPRFVAGGDRAFTDLESQSPLRGYVDAADLDDVIAEHGLIDSSADPTAVLRVVSDIAAIPRTPARANLASAPVGAIDLLESADPRGAGVADRLLRSTVRARVSSSRTPDLPRPDTTYADRRPYTVADSLDSLRGPVSGTVELPGWLDWAPDRMYDLDDESQLRVMYERVIREAQRVSDLEMLIDAGALVRVWPQMHLPARVRSLWEQRFPELVSEHGGAGAVGV